MTAPALIFDLDGTLVDSVYQHVLAWHEALQEAGIELSVWRIHRRIGMSGGLFTRALLRETGRELDEALLARLRDRHLEAYRRRIAEVRPLPGARRLLERLTELGCRFAIATSGRIGNRRARDRDARRARRHAGGHPRSRALCQAGPRSVPRGGAPARRRRRATPMVVGDSVWDMLAARRARTLGIGLLSGGYGTDELERAGAYRVYEDPAHLFEHLDEVGVRADRIGA